MDVSIETCPHYLFFTEDDMERIGAAAKCAPPLRDEAEREELWARVLDGSVDIIGSDHSPAPPDMKTGDDFLAYLGRHRGRSSHAGGSVGSRVFSARAYAPKHCGTLATNPARRFGIARKGGIEVGMDADLALVRVGGALRDGCSEPAAAAPDEPLHRVPVARQSRAHVGPRARPALGTGRFVRPE